ncbi:hypothetical protein KR018_004686 [Drosophila ironensis]|nr:hypothetical protein KR018_004686 [Drosophila ironensis]
MSSPAGHALQLDAAQLAKLTSESEEIRMRALEQVETRLIRCLQLGEPLQFKPVLLLKQLIRWFGLTPPLAHERVLSIVLELMRSEYAEAVVRKISHERFKTELEKVRRIVRCQDPPQVSDLIDELQLVLLEKYGLPVPGLSPSLTSNSAEDETTISRISQLESTLGPDDYELAWTVPNQDDVISMTAMLDMRTSDLDPDSFDVHAKVSHLTLRLSDYPAEYLLQAPYIFLQLLELQRTASSNLHVINQALLDCLHQLQRRIQVRRSLLHYAVSMDPSSARGKQLKVATALDLLVHNCNRLCQARLFRCTTENWHIMELCMEAVRAYDLINLNCSPAIPERFFEMHRTLMAHCQDMEGTDAAAILSVISIPRIQAMLLSGLTQDTVSLNLIYNKKAYNRAQALAWLQTLHLDITYLACMPHRLSAMTGTMAGICCQPSEMEQQLVRLKRCYTLALNQMQPHTRAAPARLVHSYKQICLVVDQLGSEVLVKQLFDAIVCCTPLYASNGQLRREAETVLFNLLDLQTQRLREYVYRLMPRPVVTHFHAIMNKQSYMPDCTNTTLARNHVLGLPLSSRIICKLLLVSWDPETPEAIVQWCIDYIIMLLKLGNLLTEEDFNAIGGMLLPVLPLMICRALTHKQLYQTLDPLFQPESPCLKPCGLMVVCCCHLFHSDQRMRQEATMKIMYQLRFSYGIQYVPEVENLTTLLIKDGIDLTQTPVKYETIFSDHTTEPFHGQRSLDALLRLLKTKDLRPSIRKSTFNQLNVLLLNWKACVEFSKTDDGHRLILEAMRQALVGEIDQDLAETLPPVISIMKKLMFQSARLRNEISNNYEAYVCLIRVLLIFPNVEPLRSDVSICLFQMLFSDYITATEETMMLDVEIKVLNVPVTYVLNTTPVPTYVSEGIALEQKLLQTHFRGNKSNYEQHWRLFVASRICMSPVNISVQKVLYLDIRESLKIKPCDVAFANATKLDCQLRARITAAQNCSNHCDLIRVVSEVQLILVLIRSSVALPEANGLWKLIHKYIRSVPGNSDDFHLYEVLLTLCFSCMRYCLTPITTGLNKAIESDSHHSFMLLLHDRSISLELLFMISQCMVQLIISQPPNIKLTWHGKYFKLLTDLSRVHFDLRQLQHVRCFLHILRRLCERELCYSDIQILECSQTFIKLSSDLRTSKQTGSQWQRDCLQIIYHLQTRHQPIKSLAEVENDGMAMKVMRYFLSLCGHGDFEVRGMAWVVLAEWISKRSVAIPYILTKIDWLPGGFQACCVSTLLDPYESMLIRELSGRVFLILMPHIGAEVCLELLRCHDFLKEAHGAVTTLHPMPFAHDELVGVQHSSEIISCYVSICIQLVQLKPEWCVTLCESSFMNSLSDVFKQEVPPFTYCMAYLDLCVCHIFELYVLCYRYNFDFLKRTVCRDSVLLTSFVQLTSDIMDMKRPEPMIVRLLKMFLVLCKDDNTYEFLCDSLKKNRSLYLDLFVYGLQGNYKETPIQRYTMSVLSMLFIKSQNTSEKNCFLKEMEMYVLPLEGLGMAETQLSAAGEENNANAGNNQKKSPFVKSCAMLDANGQATLSVKCTNAAVLVYQRLDRLFDSYYPLKTFNFLLAPNIPNIQICETLGAFLKVSPWAVHAAMQMKLLDRVTNLLENFLNDASIGNACIYVKRVGAHKSQNIVSNLLLLLNLLVQWHSSHHSVITDPTVAATMVKIIVRIWPWLSHSLHLKKVVMQLAMFLSEHSFEIGKQASIVQSGQSHSLLQLMVRVADHETTKKETTGSEPEKIAVPALRVMLNSCSIAEGRLSLIKMHVLDMFDTILPSSPGAIQSSKVQPMILNAWLGFWEVYSRYDVGAKLCHLHALINNVKYTTPLAFKRIICLRILRNMCFFTGNRTQLVEMAEFVNLLRDIINQPLKELDGRETSLSCFSEHRLAVLMVWKLFCFGAKYKGMLRGTKLLKMLTTLRLQLGAVKSAKPDHFAQIPYAPEVAELLKNINEALDQ